MKLYFHRNANGTIDVMYKDSKITINLHGEEHDVGTAYSNIRYNYIIDRIPVWSEFSGFNKFEIETDDKPVAKQETNEVLNNTEDMLKIDKPVEERTVRDELYNPYLFDCKKEDVHLYYCIETYGFEPPDKKCNGALECEACWNMKLRTE